MTMIADYPAEMSPVGRSGSGHTPDQVRPGVGAFGSAKTAVNVILDSDADTGDSCYWADGFFQGGTSSASFIVAAPSAPITGFVLYKEPIQEPLRPPQSRNIWEWEEKLFSGDPPKWVDLRNSLMTLVEQQWENKVRELRSPIVRAFAATRPSVTVESQLGALRGAVALPVSDLAALIGLKRRRFYDLLNGEEPERDRLDLIYAVAEAAQEIADGIGGDRRKAASALLAPVLDGDSFFDRVSQSLEAEVARSSAEELLARISGGALVGHRVPPSLRSSRDPARIEARFDSVLRGGDD